MLSYIVQSVLKNCQLELKTLGRDTSKLRRILQHHFRVSLMMTRSHFYMKRVLMISNGEMILVLHMKQLLPKIMRSQCSLPIIQHRLKPFYMQPDPNRDEVVLCADLIAPEGYGEIIGGSERVYDYELLRKDDWNRTSIR